MKKVAVLRKKFTELVKISSVNFFTSSVSVKIDAELRSRNVKEYLFSRVQISQRMKRGEAMGYVNTQTSFKLRLHACRILPPSNPSTTRGILC